MIGYKDGIEEEIIEDTQNFSEEAQIDPLNKLGNHVWRLSLTMLSKYLK